MNATEIKRLPLPDIADILFVLLLQLILFLRPDMLLADGSTGWHLVDGDYILNHQAVARTDLISYSFPDKPWVAYEWLSDAIMALLVKIGGFNLLCVCSACAIALLFSLLYLKQRKAGENYLLALSFTIFGAIVSSIHWLCRPHLFTFFGLYIFTNVLDQFWRGQASRRKLLITIALTMLVWVNTHPGFLFGFVILAVYLGCAFLRLIVSVGTESGGNAKGQIRAIGLAAAVALVATLCNPYFVQLYTYIGCYLHGSSILAATDEFASPVFHGSLQTLCLEALYGAFLIGLAVSRNRLSFPSLVIALGFGFASLSALRNLPLYVIVILPILGQLFSKTIFDPTSEPSDQPTVSKFVASVFRRFGAHNAAFTENERACSMHILPWAAFLFLSAVSLGGGKALGNEIIDFQFRSSTKPTKTLDRIAELKLDPKQGFNYDNWGGYIRYLGNIPVFIDDRADFYGEEFYSTYAQIVELRTGWLQSLQDRGIKWVLVPRDARLVNGLESCRARLLGWKLLESDSGSSLFVNEK